MNQQPMSSPAFRSPARLAESLSLSGEARALSSEAMTLSEYFELLRGRALLGDALRLLPHLLPKRRAVWWGCLCAWHALDPQSPMATLKALEAALHWVIDPSEENRRAAQVAGELAPMTTAAGCLAMAAFWSGGSMARPGLPTVPPPTDLSARVVAGAVLLAAAQRDALRLQVRYAEFLEIGLQIARGENLWAKVSFKHPADRNESLGGAGLRESLRAPHLAAMAANRMHHDGLAPFTQVVCSSGGPQLET